MPWASWDEWELVRASLFSPDGEQRRLGLERARVHALVLPRRLLAAPTPFWRPPERGTLLCRLTLSCPPQVAIWRCRGRLPLSVDLTGALVEVQLLDPAYSAAEAPGAAAEPPPAPAATASEAELRLLYSMASIRVVNGVTDTSQKVLAGLRGFIQPRPSVCPGLCKLHPVTPAGRRLFPTPPSQGRYALSVASLARRSGLPHVLVEIRHEVSARCPPLSSGVSR